MKIKIKTLLATCKAEGYTGSETDPEAMKKHLIDAGIATINLNGSDVEVKALVVETKAAKKPVIADDADDATETKSAAPDDIDAKIEAAVQARIKAHRPDGPLVRDDTPISVKSMAHALYEGDSNRVFKKAETAELFKDYMLSRCSSVLEFRDRPAVKRAVKNFERGGIWHKAYATTPDAAGGALIMEQFYPEIINNVKQYGVARKLCSIIPMGTDRITQPVAVGNYTLSYPDENTATTAGNGVTYSRVSLTAKTGVQIVQMSRQVIDDSNGSGIALMDFTARQFARAVALTEDTMLFTAAGEATYANVTGINQKFSNIGFGTAAGLLAGGGSADAHTVSQLAQLMGKLPSFGRTARTAFHCSYEFQNAIFNRVSLGQGGVTMRETADFGDMLFWQGRPIIPNNVMNSTLSTGTNTIDVLYGDISLGAIFGDRMSMEIDVSDQAYWKEYSVGMRGVVRHDINVHDVGSASAAGPIVGLYQT